MNKSGHSPLAAKKLSSAAAVSSAEVNADTTTKTPQGSNAVFYKLAGLVLAAVFSWYIYSSGSSSILNLSKATEAELQEALFKPIKPFVFYCIKVRTVNAICMSSCTYVRLDIPVRFAY